MTLVMIMMTISDNNDNNYKNDFNDDGDDDHHHHRYHEEEESADSSEVNIVTVLLFRHVSRCLEGRWQQYSQCNSHMPPTCFAGIMICFLLTISSVLIHFPWHSTLLPHPIPYHVTKPTFRGQFRIPFLRVHSMTCRRNSLKIV